MLDRIIVIEFHLRNTDSAGRAITGSQSDLDPVCRNRLTGLELIICFPVRAGFSAECTSRLHLTVFSLRPIEESRIGVSKLLSLIRDNNHGIHRVAVVEGHGR